MATEEVMIAQNQGIGQKITQVAILLETQKEATITAINLAIPSAINLVEMIKHRVKDLYQVNSFEKVPNSTKTRLIIKLSFKPLDTSAAGYQAPIPHSQVTEKSLDELKISPKKEEDFKTSGEERRGRFSSRRRFNRGGRFDRGRRDAPRRDEEGGNERENTGNRNWRRSNRPRRFRDRGQPRRGGYRPNYRRDDYSKREEGKSSGKNDSQIPPTTIKA